MTILSFPLNPNTGDQYTAENGQVYTWTGNRWQAVVGTGNADLGDLTIDGENIKNNNNGVVNIQGDNYAQLQSNETYVWVEDGNANIESNGKQWTFDNTGRLTLPEGGDITDIDGLSVLGGISGIGGLSSSTSIEQQPGNNTYTLSIGTTTDNGDSTIAIKTYQPNTAPHSGPAISIGRNIGGFHGDNVVAIGNGDVGFDTKENGVYIGLEAGWNDSEAPQGANAIAIGAYAARNIAHDNSITFNATGEYFDPTASGLYIKPVREDVLNTTKAVYYNTVTGEMTYAVPTSGGVTGLVIDGGTASTQDLELNIDGGGA